MLASASTPPCCAKAAPPPPPAAPTFDFDPSPAGRPRRSIPGRRDSTARALRWGGPPPLGGAASTASSSGSNTFRAGGADSARSMFGASSGARRAGAAVPWQAISGSAKAKLVLPAALGGDQGAGGGGPRDSSSGEFGGEEDDGAEEAALQEARYSAARLTRQLATDPDPAMKIVARQCLPLLVHGLQARARRLPNMQMRSVLSVSGHSSMLAMGP